MFYCCKRSSRTTYAFPTVLSANVCVGGGGVHRAVLMSIKRKQKQKQRNSHDPNKQVWNPSQAVVDENECGASSKSAPVLADMNLTVKGNRNVHASLSSCKDPSSFVALFSNKRMSQKHNKSHHLNASPSRLDMCDKKILKNTSMEIGFCERRHKCNSHSNPEWS